MKPNPKAMIFLASVLEDIKQGGKKYRHAVPSPCMSVCHMDEQTKLCQGCLRTLDEIVNWGNADDARRRVIWQAIEVRLAGHSA
jgi:predicted Fe-S protein YdhL (DUF1289 family)